MKKTFLFCAFFIIALTSKAQLVYESNALRFNGPFFSSGVGYATTWYGQHHIWAYSTNTSLPHFRMGFTAATAMFGTNMGSWHFQDVGTFAYNTLYAAKFTTASDLALKTNIVNVSGATKTVLALRPVTYQWKNPEYLDNKRSPLAGNNPKEIGFIAQEVEKVLPDIISIDEQGIRLMDYSAIIPILTSAIQELNARIEQLEQQLKAR